MSTGSFQVLFAVLAIASNIATVIVVATRLGSARMAPLAKLRTMLEPYVLPFTFVVAAVTMSGSLYFSEIALAPPHMVPCPLCWFQRCAAYPSAILLGIATFRRDLSIRVYVIPLALIGATISVYHLLIENSILNPTASCKVGASCADVWFTEFGFITLAYMALSSFLLVASALALPPRRSA